MGVNELIIQMTVPFLNSALGEAGGDRVPRAELAKVRAAWGCVVAVWSVVKRVTCCALRTVLIGQKPKLPGQRR